ncbi:hypothetical protein ACJ73_10193 [Blastomyces percursus]|uniref:HTH CENPB-type domain-containing protein n=1 Tax=Blastomyces percursus TaxID=1658174 RepID=A0A1J9PP30_9EURO|nr:hypothetical protein ACJ73_10193 [Blastomyces percursus]
MPPIRGKNAINSIELEGRLELAISAIKNQEASSTAEAARLFNLNEDYPRGQRLLRIWLIIFLSYGILPLPPRVGKNWVSNLIKRRTELQWCYSRRYNHERAKCEDRRVIQDWFKTLGDIIAEHGIQSEDVTAANLLAEKANRVH